MLAMAETDWGQMALNNDFAYDDFSCVGHTSLKGYIPKYGFLHKKKFGLSTKKSKYIYMPL